MAVVLEDLESLILCLEEGMYPGTSLANLRYALLNAADRLLAIERSVEEEAEKP
jgi:hypothetical protein